jgi:hypothetical protein
MIDSFDAIQFYFSTDRNIFQLLNSHEHTHGP